MKLKIKYLSGEDGEIDNVESIDSEKIILKSGSVIKYDTESIESCRILNETINSDGLEEINS